MKVIRNIFRNIKRDHAKFIFMLKSLEKWERIHQILSQTSYKTFKISILLILSFKNEMGKKITNVIDFLFLFWNSKKYS